MITYDEANRQANIDKHHLDFVGWKPNKNTLLNKLYYS